MTTRDVMAPLVTVVDPEMMATLPWHPLEGYEGVTYKLFWRSGKSVAGVMRIAPGRSMAPHEHQRSHHHIWVLEGEGEMNGRHLTAGTYVHVPARASHGMGPAGPEGCTFLYLYLREEGAGGDPSGGAGPATGPASGAAP